MSVFVLALVLGMAGTSKSAQAQSLDLASLAAFDYTGKGAMDSRPCSLSVSEIGRDFSGRYFQDFRAWVNGRADLNFSIRLKGPERYRTPEASNGQVAQFSIPMDVYVLVLQTNAADPSRVLEYELFEGMGSGAVSRIHCVGIKAQPR